MLSQALSSRRIRELNPKGCRDVTFAGVASSPQLNPTYEFHRGENSRLSSAHTFVDVTETVRVSLHRVHFSQAPLERRPRLHFLLRLATGSTEAADCGAALHKAQIGAEFVEQTPWPQLELQSCL